MAEIPREILARLVEAGRSWLRQNGINMTDSEVSRYNSIHIPIFARLGLGLSSQDTLALMRAYMNKKSPLTEQEILSLVGRKSKMRSQR